MLLTAVVRDKALNPLSGVAVEFFVKSGQAYFAPENDFMIASMNGKTGQKITLRTDKNGLVAVRPYIGEEEGLVEIQARLATIATIGGSANNASPTLADVIYKLQAKAAKDGPTSFSGRVFDDKGLPIAGVTLSIARTLNSTTTDAKGQFNFNDIPAGRIDLFVDGRTVNPNLDSAKPQYPSLHFEAYAVQGQANSLTHPIYMPPLLITPQSAKLVGAQDTTLTLPNLAGFSMFIKKGSVTFPDGSKTGQLIVSPVTADRLPMSPPSGGAIFGLPAWTIQPAGTRFDPPIEVRMPNNTALPPGSRTPVIQWDHDLGQYTAMGYATVSEDGSQLITEAGSGISKAGWGGACVYTPGATATGAAGAAGGGDGPPPPPCEKPIPPLPRKISDVKIEVDGWDEKVEPVEFINRPIKFSASATISGICTPKYKWDMGDGTPKVGKRITHAYKDGIKANVTLKVVCESIPANACFTAGPEVVSENKKQVYATNLKLQAAWSDQFPGREVNGWIDSGRGFSNDNKTGPTNKPYGLMAVRNDDYGYVKVKYELKPDEPRVRELLKFGFAYGSINSPLSLGESGACPNATGQVGGNEACIKIKSPLAQDLVIKWGMDKNKDGKLALGAMSEFPDLSTQKGHWKFKMISKSNLAQRLQDYDNGVSLFGPVAREWLNSFRNGNNPGGVSSEATTIDFRKKTGLSHSIGAIPFGGDLGITKNVVHKTNSAVVWSIMRSPNFSGWIYDVLKTNEVKKMIVSQIGSKKDWVKLKVKIPYGDGDRPKLTTHRTGTTSVNYADLYAILGDAQTVDATIEMQAAINPLDPNLIMTREIHFVSGSLITDLFDWDHDIEIMKVSAIAVPVLGPMARAGASIQAAHGTIAPNNGVGGIAFYNVYHLDPTMVFDGIDLFNY